MTLTYDQWLALSPAEREAEIAAYNLRLAAYLRDYPHTPHIAEFCDGLTTVEAQKDHDEEREGTYR